MQIVWDEPKRRTNLETRSLDFAQLDIEFFVEAVIVTAKLGRFKAIGRFDEAVLTVIFARLGAEAVSVISMRRASAREREIHDQVQRQVSR